MLILRELAEDKCDTSKYSLEKQQTVIMEMAYRSYIARRYFNELESEPSWGVWKSEDPGMAIATQVWRLGGHNYIANDAWSAQQGAINARIFVDVAAVELALPKILGAMRIGRFMGEGMTFSEARMINAIGTELRSGSLEAVTVAESAGLKDFINSTEFAEALQFKAFSNNCPKNLAPRSVVANGACFVAGTLVATENGKRPIEEIEQGDKVWSFNHESKEWELRAVVEPLIHNYDGNIYSIEVAGERIEATHNHPFWVVEGENLSNRSKADDVPLDEHESLNGGRWVAAEELEVGDLLKLKNGSSARIENISSRSASTLVYNITVEELHNYAVGSGEILVHNKANVRILQSRGRTLNQSTADELNEVFGTNLNRREMGRALEALKKEHGLRNDFHGKIDALGNFLDDAGDVIDNIGSYIP